MLSTGALVASADWTDFTIALPTIINLAFMFAFGACAGSFIHVVAYRMPAGLSVISPPSRCPVCGFRLPWHQNVPIIGYLTLRGRCAACKVGIPARYVFSEIALGLLFAGIYAVLFLPGTADFWYPVGEGWWHAQGALRALPALFVVLWATGALVAMTICDARTYLIPVALPGWASVVAFVGWPIVALMSLDVGLPFPVSVPAWPVGCAAIGAMGGLAVARMLLAAGVLPRSFEDWDQYAADEGDVFADYPYARREMMKEIAFVGPAVLFGAVGWAVGQWLGAPLQPWPAGNALMACATGFVIGGGIVWALRIIASLLLDTEALGLGDVHLMACVGAAFGWRVAVVGFVVAPFIGLAWWVGNLFRRAPMRMPFGPSLAVGSLSAFLLKPVLATAVAGGLSAMAVLASNARLQPGGALALSAVLALGAAAFARVARWTGGGAAAASILLMVTAVVGWILASPVRVGMGAAVGVLVIICCVVGSAISGAALEEMPGPRTALSRILRLLAFVVTVVAAFILVIRPGSAI
ncbi:MAG: prepilin peptidase [Proteobacteria bacterium]|nr:prepilin peptidase [Pseudomonadota bacterium]